MIKNKTWDGNSYNNLGEQTYKYTEINTSKTTGTYTFDSTLTVLQEDHTDLLDKRYKLERYAKNVGMVYREYTDIHSNTIVNGVPVTNRISKGVICKFTVNSYGY